MGRDQDRDAARLTGVLSELVGFDGSWLLRDPKFPDPVVPPDLHLVKPVHADADGNVPCFRCGTLSPLETADLAGSQGYVCRPCQVPILTEELEDASLRPRLGRKLALAAAIVAVAVLGAIVVGQVVGSGRGTIPPHPRHSRGTDHAARMATGGSQECQDGRNGRIGAL